MHVPFSGLVLDATVRDEYRHGLDPLEEVVQCALGSGSARSVREARAGRAIRHQRRRGLLVLWLFGGGLKNQLVCVCVYVCVRVCVRECSCVARTRAVCVCRYGVCVYICVGVRARACGTHARTSLTASISPSAHNAHLPRRCHRLHEFGRTRVCTEGQLVPAQQHARVERPVLPAFLGLGRGWPQ